MLGGLIRELVSAAAESNRIKYPGHLGYLAGGLVFLLALMLALDQLGLDIDLLVSMLTLAIGALFAGLALAFGLGAGDSVRNILAGHYVRKSFHPGQRVRLQDIEGEIIELTPVAVVIDTERGSAVVPARLFTEQASLVLDPAEEDDA
jgi:small-conductance mechanosensitive channel